MGEMNNNVIRERTRLHYTCNTETCHYKNRFINTLIKLKAG